jgi:hypothetical protein
MGIIVLDQWNPKPNPQKPGVDERPIIKRRSIMRKGKMYSNGNFPLISDNAEAFYLIEH